LELAKERERIKEKEQEKVKEIKPPKAISVRKQNKKQKTDKDQLQSQIQAIDSELARVGRPIEIKHSPEKSSLPLETKSDSNDQILPPPVTIIE